MLVHHAAKAEIPHKKSAEFSTDGILHTLNQILSLYNLPLLESYDPTTTEKLNR